MRLASVTIHMDRILDMTAEDEWFDRDEMTFRPVRYERGDVDA
jgi:hypothetical protein